jgi:hypothetical protein
LKKRSESIAADVRAVKLPVRAKAPSRHDQSYV